MTVMTDLFKLYKSNLDNHALGVATHEDINGNVVKNYFNAGMILFDINTIKSRYTIEQMLTFIKENQGRFEWYDESIMKIFYRKDVLYLEHKYNYLLSNRLLDKKYPFDPKDVIVHYIGVVKPWHKRYFSFKNKKYCSCQLEYAVLYNNNITSLEHYIQLVEEWIEFYNTTRIKNRNLN